MPGMLPNTVQNTLQGLPGQGQPTQGRHIGSALGSMYTRMPRPPVDAQGPDMSYQPASGGGYGSRSLWSLPAVGEAARRDPHQADPTPGLHRPPVEVGRVSPATGKRGGMYPGDGYAYDGFPARSSVINPIGSVMTRTLARNQVAGTLEARWRVGGVSYPFDFGYGPGYHGDAQTVWPNNPQVYLRNPGIRPLANVPETFRYAAMGGVGIQELGPSIADVGHLTQGRNAR